MKKSREIMFIDGDPISRDGFEEVYNKSKIDEAIPAPSWAVALTYGTETEAVEKGQKLLKEIDQYFANRKLIIYLVEIWDEDLVPLPTRFAFHSEIKANTKAQELQHIYDNVSVSAITVE